MKKTLLVIAIVLLLAVSMISLVATEISLATAIAGQAQDNCPPDWTQYVALDNDGYQRDRRLVGTDMDHNGDGFICGKRVGRDHNIYVLMDNKTPN